MLAFMVYMALLYCLYQLIRLALDSRTTKKAWQERHRMMIEASETIERSHWHSKYALPVSEQESGDPVSTVEDLDCYRSAGRNV
jgi:hypothetical protein